MSSTVDRQGCETRWLTVTHKGVLIEKAIYFIFVKELKGYGLVEWTLEGYRRTAEGKRIIESLNELRKKKENRLK